MVQVSVIYGGSRPDGNAAILAEEVVEGIAAVRVRLDQYPTLTIDDRRHQAEGFGPIDKSYAEILNQVMDCPIWVIASPIYWYGFPANLKGFVDGWSHAMRRPEWRFSERMAQKRAYLVLAGGDNPRLKGLALVSQFYWIADFMKLTFADYVIGEGNQPGEVRRDAAALARARDLNAEIRNVLGQE